MAVQLEDCRNVLRAARSELLQRRNVVAVGVGYKTVNGKKTDELALICSVEVKAAKARRRFWTLERSPALPKARLACLSRKADAPPD